jgi:autotransporter-associated beta strand protein
VWLWAGACLAACALSAPAADVVWTGTTDDLNVGANWSSGAKPLEADRAVFNGSSAVNDTWFSNSFQGAGAGIGGMLVTSGQTDPLQINARGSALVFRLQGGNGVTIESGAGPVTFGALGDSFFLNMGGVGGTSGFVNHSANTATLAENAVLGNGGSTTQVAAFSGNGDWRVDGVIRVGGGGSVSISKAGPGVLTLTAANTYNGSTTLGGGTTVLSGGNNRLPTGTALRLLNANNRLELAGLSQTVASLSFPVTNAGATASIAGTGGHLIVNGASALQIGPSGSLSATRLVEADFSGLSQFTYASATTAFRVGLASGSQNTAALGQVALATLAAQNTITASALLVGDVTANSDGGLSTLRFGEVNQVNTGALNFGAGGRSDVVVEFAPGATDPSLTIRGTAGGATAAGNWQVGRVSQFSTAGQLTFSATANFASGTLDAKVSSLVIGSADTGGATTRAGTQNSSFTMGRGELETSSLIVGRVAGGGSIGGNYAGNGTFTLNHADGVVRAVDVVLGDNTITATGAFTKNARGTFNLQAGTLVASSLSRGSQVGTGVSSVTFNWTSGTLENTPGNDLLVTQIPLTLLAGQHTFHATGANLISLDSASPVGGEGGFRKTGDGILVLGAAANPVTGTVSVEAGTLSLQAAANNNLASASEIRVGAGATLNTSGLAGGALDLAAGQTLSGHGTVSGGLVVDLDAILSPGSSTGALTVDTLLLAGGGELRFELDRVDPFAVGQDSLRGQNDGHDAVEVTGALSLTATALAPFVLTVVSLAPSDLPGSAEDWNPNQDYTWRVITADGGLSGFAADAIDLRVGEFAAHNTLNGTFSVSADANHLFLHYTTAIPEPTSASALLLGALFLRHFHRRRAR